MTKMRSECHTGFYTKRHSRRIIQKQTNEAMKRIRQSMKTYFDRKPISSMTENQSSTDAQLEHVHTPQHLVNDKEISDIMGNTVLVDNSLIVDSVIIDPVNAEASEEVGEVNNWDSTDERIIHNDLEFNYRYSDCEDSDCDETEYSNCSRSVEPVSTKSITSSSSSVFRDTVSKSEVDIVSSQLRSLLPDWALDNYITQTAFTDLLHRIRSDVPLLKLPLDSRTLVKTPCHTTIHKVDGGEYCHFSLKSCLEKIIMDRILMKITDTNIDLLVNMDGAPVGKSTAKTLWPILCSDRLRNNVYIVGIFNGSSKPENSDQFLKFFVEEAKMYVNNGITVSNINYDVTIDGLICDAPAKAYILGVKCHSGYSCCTKCEITGERHKCVCFPGGISTLRTDEKFNKFAYTDEETKKTYQLKKTTLTQIPKLGLVTQVPLDPMHLVFLGVCRKLFLIWLFAACFYKLPSITITRISEAMVKLACHIPYEFARKPRKLKDIKFFKATEWRQIMLYTGIIFLKDNVSQGVYNNFVTLHVAISILCNPLMVKHGSWVDYAEKLLNIFVQKFQKLYGRRYVSYNVHALYHLANDVRRYGALDNFSAFRFENFIGCIKRLIRSGNQPLQQLSNRFAELENVKNKNSIVIDDSKPTLQQQHDNSPLTSNFTNASQYKVAQFNSFKINCDDDKNSYVYIDCEHVVKASNFVQSNNQTFLIGQKMDVIGPFYTYPCSSSKLGINIIKENRNILYVTYSITQITAKILILPYKNQKVAFPILHTLREKKSQ